MGKKTWAGGKRASGICSYSKECPNKAFSESKSGFCQEHIIQTRGKQKERIENLKKSGLCQQCREPSKEGKTFCEGCISKTAQKKLGYEASGLCSNCGQNKAREGLKQCEKCAEYTKGKKQTRKELGICTHSNSCSNKSVEGYATGYCQIHMDLIRGRQRVVIEERKQAGLCQLCGSPRKDGATLCISCLSKHAQRKLEYEAAGLCNNCGKGPPREGLKRCERCARKAKGKSLKKFGLSLEEYEKRKLEQGGKCFLCPRTEAENHVVKKGGKVRELSVDHNHVTGETRKLLCSECNFTVGFLERNKGLIPKFLAYIGYSNG